MGKLVSANIRGGKYLQGFLKSKLTIVTKSEYTHAFLWVFYIFVLFESRGLLFKTVFFSPSVLWRNDWHTSLYKFKAQSTPTYIYCEMIHSRFSKHPFSYKIHKKKRKKKREHFFSLWYKLLGFTILSCVYILQQTALAIASCSTLHPYTYVS